MPISKNITWWYRSVSNEFKKNPTYSPSRYFMKYQWWEFLARQSVIVLKAVFEGGGGVLLLFLELHIFGAEPIRIVFLLLHCLHSPSLSRNDSEPCEPPSSDRCPLASYLSRCLLWLSSSVSPQLYLFYSCHDVIVILFFPSRRRWRAPLIMISPYSHSSPRAL